jgi:hypothetical protein
MRRAAATTTVVIVAFVVLSLIAIAFKSKLSVILISPIDAFVPDYADWIGVCIDAGRPCLRATTAILGQSFEEVFGAVAGLFFWNADTSLFFMGSPWEIHDVKGTQVFNWFVPLSAYLSLCLVLLLPLLVVCRRFFNSFAERILFLLVAFSALIGWHPVLVNLFFKFAAVFIDWPRSYYLFSSKFCHYDFGTIALLLLALLYLARRGRRSWLGVAAFAVLAQATFENLGLVFAAGVFFAALVNQPHDGNATVFRRALADALVAAGAAVLSAFMLSALFITLVDTASSQAGESAVVGFMSETWWTVVNNNFGWIRTVIANVITMMVYPLIMGIAIGTLGGFRGDVSDTARYDAALSIAITGGGLAFGFLVSVGIGLFFIAYPAEMGRQITPLAVLLVVPAAKIAEVFVLRIRRMGSV